MLKGRFLQLSDKICQLFHNVPVRRSISTNHRNKVFVHNYLDRILPYTTGWKLQQQILQDRFNSKKGDVEVAVAMSQEPVNRILLLQHSPTYTLGRGAKEEYLTFLDEDILGKDMYEQTRKVLARQGGKRLSLSSANDEEHFKSACVFAPNGVPLYRVERGGEITFHGPGQIVCYPLLDLTEDPFKKDLHW